MKKYFNNINRNFLLHCYYVAKVAEHIGRQQGLSEEELENLIVGALIHDVGKLYIPDQILGKPGSLTPEEYIKVKDHSVLGCYSDLADWLDCKDINQIIKYHHERFDGSGYPDGISGYDIPLFARIVAIADSYDAMRAKRVYKNAIEAEKAIKEIENCSGTLYDPKIVDDFVKEEQPRILALRK